MKPLAAVLLLLAVVNAGLAFLLPLRGGAAASVLQKEAWGKLSVVGDALDLPLAVQRTEAALGRTVEPDFRNFATWLTESRGEAEITFHNTAGGFMLFNSVAFAACAVGVLLIMRRSRASANSTVA